MPARCAPANRIEATPAFSISTMGTVAPADVLVLDAQVSEAPMWEDAGAIRVCRRRFCMKVRFFGQIWRKLEKKKKCKKFQKNENFWKFEKFESEKEAFFLKMQFLFLLERSIVIFEKLLEHSRKTSQKMATFLDNLRFFSPNVEILN